MGCWKMSKMEFLHAEIQKTKVYTVLLDTLYKEIWKLLILVLPNLHFENM